MADISGLRKELENRLVELGAKVNEIEGDLRASHSADWSERATEIEDDEMLESIAESSIHEIEAIRSALRRMDAGTYGTCTSCGEAIVPKRLEALPYAEKCIKCAEAD